MSFVRPRKPQRVVSLAATPEPVAIDLARSALLIVDMQNDFLHADGWFPRSGVDTSPVLALLPTLNALTAAARAADMPVIWLNWGVRADCANIGPALLDKGRLGGRRPGYADPSPSGRGHILVRDEWGSQIIDGLTVGPDDLTIYKHRFSGFWDNELDSVLRNRDVTTLIFAGINIDRCVFATLTDASFLGYDCVLLEDATATPSPAFVTQAIHYLVNLLYGVVAKSDAFIAALGKPASTIPSEQDRSAP